jgi:hypothetical protein
MCRKELGGAAKYRDGRRPSCCGELREAVIVHFADGGLSFSCRETRVLDKKRRYRKLAAHALTLELVAIPGLLPINAVATGNPNPQGCILASRHLCRPLAPNALSEISSCRVCKDLPISGENIPPHRQSGSEVRAER